MENLHKLCSHICPHQCEHGSRQTKATQTENRALHKASYQHVELAELAWVVSVCGVCTVCGKTVIQRLFLNMSSYRMIRA